MPEYTVYGTAPSGNDFTAPVEAQSEEEAVEKFQESVEDNDFEVEGAEL